MWYRSWGQVNPTDAQSAVTKAIIGVDSRHFALSEINVGYRICDPGDRNTDGCERRCRTDGLLDTCTGRGDPSKLRFCRLVQTLWIEPVRYWPTSCRT